MLAVLYSDTAAGTAADAIGSDSSWVEPRPAGRPGADNSACRATDGATAAEPDPAAGPMLQAVSDCAAGGEIAHLLLTRRAAGLRRHAHEVSFPGGHVDADDDGPFQTALREAHEEIGLDPASVRCVGALGSYATLASETVIHPFVALSDSVPEVHVASPREVEAVIAVSLAELLAGESWREEIWPFPGGERAMTFFEIPGDTIWGATAAMLRDLLTIATAPAVDAVQEPIRSASALAPCR